MILGHASIYWSWCLILTRHGEKPDLADGSLKSELHACLTSVSGKTFFFFKFPLLKIYKNLIFCFCISWQVSGLGHEGTFIITYIYIYSYVCWWHCFPESFCCNNPSPIAWEGSLKNSAIDWGLLSGEFRTTYHENSNRMVPTFIGFSSCFNPTTGGCWKFNRPSISRVLHETPEAASIATEGRRRDLSVNEIPGCKFWTCAIFASMQIMNI